MNTERDMTRIVRSWLRTDEHESADRVLDSMVALLDTTPQRRSTWPARRFVDMNTYAKLAIAAAAVVVVALVGINLWPAGDRAGIGGPAVSPSPTAPSQPSPSPTPAAYFPPAGELAIGRHSMIREGVPFSISVLSPGWVSQQGFEFITVPEGAPNGAGFIFWAQTPDSFYADPCGAEPLSPAAGPGIESLANAASRIPGTTLVSGPSDVTVGGHPAKRIAFTIPADVGCPANSFHLWNGRWPTALPTTMWVWMVDVDGTIVWIDGETYKDTSPTLEREIQQMIDSIQFE